VSRRRAIATGVVVWLMAMLVTTPAWATSAQPTLRWRVPAASDVTWRGMLPAEGGAVGSGPQIGPYFVPGPAGLLVAVVTHGAIMQGVQASQRKREQDEADKVLEAYAGALKAWPASQLWEAAAGTRDVLWDGQMPAPGPVVELQPVFSLAQDESALLLDVAVKISMDSSATTRVAAVRVVSSPLVALDARMHWSADDAKQLKATAAAMLAHAVELAARHAGAAAATPDAEPPARTHRYVQGAVDRAERAQQLAGDCGRVVLRTLRGGLLSVPLARTAANGCEVQVTF
jgi:hypothetical protein